MSLSNLFGLFNRSGLTAVESMEARAGEGDADAQFGLGLKLATGEGMTKDYVLAVRWYLRAALQSHRSAQFNLGTMYSDGHGVQVDKTESLLWFQKAADLGHPGAQHNVGIAHHHTSLSRMPRNASESRIEAYKWLQLASAQGLHESEIACELVIFQMTDEEVAEGHRRVTAFAVTEPVGQV